MPFSPITRRVTWRSLQDHCGMEFAASPPCDDRKEASRQPSNAHVNNLENCNHPKEMLHAPMASDDKTKGGPPGIDVRNHAAVRSRSQPPLATRPNPDMRDICQPGGIAFSASTKMAIAAIQRRFITPPTNKSAISIQQQPRQ